MRISTFVLACAVALSLAAPGLAEGHPHSGTGVGLDHDPQGIIAKGTTDGDGHVVFRDVKPGKYTLVIGGGRPLDAPVGTTIHAEIKFEGTTNVETLLNGFSVESCACKTDQPIRIGFTVPEGAPVVVHLRLTWYSPDD